MVGCITADGGGGGTDAAVAGDGKDVPAEDGADVAAEELKFDEEDGGGKLLIHPRIG